MFKWSFICLLSIFIWSCARLDEEISCSSLTIRLKAKAGPTVCSPPNGTISVFAQGGKPPYSFRLNDGPFQADSLFSALQSGNYVVEAMDANQCNSFTNIDLPSLGSDLSATFTTTVDTDCVAGNGQIMFTPSGGVPPYSLKFKGIIESSLVLTGLKNGIHQASIVDDQLCEFVMAFTIPKGNTNTSWSIDIEPIIDMRCAKPLCHVAGTGRSDLSKVENVQLLALQIKTNTQTGFMPFDEPMPANEIQLIACWVDDGALNN